MAKRQYFPQFKVTLFQVAEGRSATYDITDWFGEGCSIHTHKSVREPAGQFQLVVLDKKHEWPDGDHSVYTRVAPMDVIEIRATHDGSQGATKLIMRGFVSDVRRDESMGGDGKPVRRVTISGQDIGKLMLIHMIHFYPVAKEKSLVLNGYGVLIKYFGPSPKPYQANEFAATFADIMNEHLDSLLSDSDLYGLQISAQPLIDGIVPAPFAAALENMTFYQAMCNLLDVGPFHELFTEDNDDGADLIVRENFTGDEGITFTTDDVVAASVFRSDAQVSNWFYAFPRAGGLQEQITLMMVADKCINNANAREVESCKEDVYGWRKMQVNFSLYPPQHGDESAPLEDEYKTNQTSVLEWTNEKTLKLRLMNYKNAQLEHGRFRIRGNEEAKAGTWATLNKGDVVDRYYIVSVGQEISFYGGWTTTLEMERGDGYETRKDAGLYREELNLSGAIE